MADDKVCSVLGFENVCWASIGVQCAGLQLECSVLASIGVPVCWASIGDYAGL